MPQHVAHRSCDILWQCLKVGCPSSTLRQIATWHHFHWSDVLVNPAGMASWWSHLSRTSCCLMLEVTFLSRHNKTSECKVMNVMTPICAFHQIHVSPRRSTCSHGLVPSCSSLLQHNFQIFPRSITEYHGPGEACCTPWCGHGKCRPTTLPSLLSLEPKPRHRSHKEVLKAAFVDGFHTADGRNPAGVGRRFVLLQL